MSQFRGVPIGLLGLPMALRAHRARKAAALVNLGFGPLNASPGGDLPRLLLQAVVLPERETDEGTLIQCVTFPWYEIIAEFKKNPNAVHAFDWRRWEEIVAGAYRAQGFEVTLTPRSGDGGRDVIAEKRGFGAIRILDQVKKYGPGQLVDANDVRAMLGVLHADSRATKAVVSTTAEFAPGVLTDPAIQQYVPYRLELRDRPALLSWLTEAAS